MFAIFAAWQGYRTRTYAVTPAPDRLLDYLALPDEETKLAVVDALVAVYLRQKRPMREDKQWQSIMVWCATTALNCKEMHA